MLIEELLALRGHAVYIEVVQQQCLCVLAQGIGLDHTLCEHSWVLSTEEKLDPWHPVLADQEGWPSWCQAGAREKGIVSQALWIGAPGCSLALLLMHGSPEPGVSLF